MKKSKEYLQDKYKNLQLGGGYGGPGWEKFVSDFLDISKLADFVVRCWGDADKGLTKEGVEFLEEAFGWEAVRDEAYKQWFSFDSKTPQDERKKDFERWWFEKREIALKYGCM